jgi:outer membrane protein assembly factor BamD
MSLRIIITAIFLIFVSCSKKEAAYTPTEKIDPYVVYKEGYEAFTKGDYFYASKKFFEAEINFTILELAAKSAIMGSYSLYGINFYDEAFESIERYLKKYPADKNVAYAHYLTAIIYYEQITDEKKDMEPLLKTKKKIDYFLQTFPNNEYAIDLKFKKDLIINQMAAKELYIAKYYISVQKWIPAINRLKDIVEKYDQTIFIEEALHRLVEINYTIGLENEAKKYANILGYNYNSSEWFQQSYKILNKNYKIITKKKPEKKTNIIKKIIKKIK